MASWLGGIVGVKARHCCVSRRMSRRTMVITLTWMCVVLFFLLWFVLGFACLYDIIVVLYEGNEGNYGQLCAHLCVLCFKQ